MGKANPNFKWLILFSNLLHEGLDGSDVRVRYKEQVLAQNKATAVREDARSAQRAFLKDAAQQLADSARCEGQRRTAEAEARVQAAKQQQLHQTLGQLREAKQAQEAVEQARREAAIQAGLPGQQPCALLWLCQAVV